MWGRKRRVAEARVTAEAGRLKAAIREVRIQSAERSAVVVDLRDAEVARLELLNEQLDTLFKEIPPEVELFDRGISRGDPPRLWIDMVAHVVMARDKRHYRLVQDTRYGLKVLEETTEIPEMVEAVTHYVASRLVDRERAMASDRWSDDEAQYDVRIIWRRKRWRMVRAFVFGLLMGFIALCAALWILAMRLPPPQ